MSYAWLITKDHITPENEGWAVGVHGPRNVKLTPEQIKVHPEAKAFIMLDDDGEQYYQGLYVGPDDETLFAPLDDYGTPNAGATTIFYRNEAGAWKQL